MTLIILGCGGHGRVVAAIAHETRRFDTIAFSDPAHPIGTRVDQWAVEYRDEDLSSAVLPDSRLIIGVGQLGVARLRTNLFATLAAVGHELATVVSPAAVVSCSASVGTGSFVGHHALVHVGATVGENCIINSGAIVEHDARVGDHVHLSTRSTVNGGAAVGDRSMIGSGAVLLHGVTVGSDVVVGAGAVVTKDLPDPGTYVGVPARRLERD